MIMHHTEDTTIEQTDTEMPEIKELSHETPDRAPGRGGLFVLLRVSGPGRL
jgi:hypothetical protein